MIADDWIKLARKSYEDMEKKVGSGNQEFDCLIKKEVLVNNCEKQLAKASKESKEVKAEYKECMNEKEISYKKCREKKKFPETELEQKIRENRDLNRLIEALKKKNKELEFDHLSKDDIINNLKIKNKELQTQKKSKNKFQKKLVKLYTKQRNKNKKLTAQ